MLNSSLTKQKFIIKPPEKPQRTASVRNRAAVVEPSVKKTRQLRSKTVHNSVKKTQETSNHEKLKQKMIAPILGSTKGEENVLVPKITPFCLSPPPSNIINCKIFFPDVKLPSYKACLFVTVKFIYMYV